jgi:hypothetical protein
MIDEWIGRVLKRLVKVFFACCCLRLFRLALIDFVRRRIVENIRSIFGMLVDLIVSLELGIENALGFRMVRFALVTYGGDLDEKSECSGVVRSSNALGSYSLGSENPRMILLTKLLCTICTSK